MAYIDHAIDHEVPNTKVIISKVSVADELIEDPGVVLDPHGVQHGLSELVAEEVAVCGHIIGGDEGVVDHCKYNVSLHSAVSVSARSALWDLRPAFSNKITAAVFSCVCALFGFMYIKFTYFLKQRNPHAYLHRKLT